MMSDYYDSAVTWKHATVVDSYNQPTYTTYTNIPCKIIEKNKLVRNKEGTHVVSMATAYTDSAVCVDDLFNGRVVIAVNKLSMLEHTEGYEVYLI